jgi:hypothetical protein
MIGAYYERLFGEPPRAYNSPLECNNHPELDDSRELDAKDTTKYKLMIGALQWVILLGRFDVLTAIMTMSSFRSCPRISHLEQLKCMIRVRVGMPNKENESDVEYNWMYLVYGKVKEIFPHNMPEPLGKEVVSITYKYANLYHNMITGRAVTGILHMLNSTPVDWFSK